MSYRSTPYITKRGKNKHDSKPTNKMTLSFKKEKEIDDSNMPPKSQTNFPSLRLKLIFIFLRKQKFGVLLP